MLALTQLGERRGLLRLNAVQLLLPSYPDCGAKFERLYFISRILILSMSVRLCVQRFGTSDAHSFSPPDDSK